MHYPHSSIQGRIDRLLLSYREDEKHQQLIRSLIENLHESTRFLLFANKPEALPSAYAFARSFLSESHIQVRGTFQKGIKVLIDAPGEGFRAVFSPWVRDPLIGLQTDDPDKPQVFASAFGDRGNPFDDGWPIVLKSAGHIAGHLEDRHFEIEGGNVLINEDFVLIGQNQMCDVATLLYESHGTDRQPAEFLRPLFSNPNRPARPPKKIISVGILAEDKRRDDDVARSGQPEETPPDPFKNSIWFGEAEVERIDFSMPESHIDLFLSMAGRHPETGNHVLLLAEAIPLTTDLEEKCEAINSMLKIIEEKLHAQLSPIHIFRNQVPLMPGDTLYYPCAYNNCIVEIHGTQKNVYLPSFLSGTSSDNLPPALKAKIRDAEKQNRCIWQDKLKFEVVFIEADFHYFMSKGGALHCLTNDLSRIH